MLFRNSKFMISNFALHIRKDSHNMNLYFASVILKLYSEIIIKI